MLLIQGFFFQQRNGLSIAFRSETEGGVGAIIQRGLFKYMYSGIIFPDSESETGLAGEMVDIFGESILSDVKVGEHEVFFTKRYVNRTDTMAYQFHREGNLWVGGYSGSAVCNGGAKCIITDVPNDFFLPPK